MKHAWVEDVDDPPSADGAPPSSEPVMVLEPNDDVRTSLVSVLAGLGWGATAASSVDLAAAILQRRPPPVVLADWTALGTAGLRRLAGIAPSTEWVVLAADGDVAQARDALLAGARAFFPRPIRDWERLLGLLAASLDAHRRMASPGPRPGALGPGLYRSAAMTAVAGAVARVAPTPAPVLITGETGSGKELVAAAIHETSGRRGAFVAINCSALPAHLVESELFGHVKGAFTGAVESRAGLVEAAAGGSLFLDEIGDLPIDLQARLLRLLENQTYRRVGDRGPERTMDARVIAATHVDLPAAVKAGRFREDLFYRLGVFGIEVPPLRARVEDIELLALAFVAHWRDIDGHRVTSVAPEVIGRLERWLWPGNVRELRNAMRQACFAVGDAGELGLAHLPLPIQTEAPAAAEAVTATAVPTGTYAAARAKVVADFTASYLRQALDEAGGDVAVAARASGLLRTNFWRLMRQFGVSRE